MQLFVVLVTLENSGFMDSIAECLPWAKRLGPGSSFPGQHSLCALAVP